MNRLEHKKKTSALRAHRVRARAKGTTERPRLSVTITNLHISAQIINDAEHKTLAAATTVGQKAVKGTMTERAAWVGAQIASAAKSKKVVAVVFDRGDKKYHGRIKALADAAREGGLSF
jgi:large subunit ribosomal protein L18